MESDKKKGTLYLVATPIGNLEDITFRAVRLLAECDIIAAEDTRRTKNLLNHLNITYKSLTSYHEHNKRTKGEVLLKRMVDGASVALVTDAGTPGISDPGSDLVASCISEGITVTSVPGACAAVAALTISGLPAGRFIFEGFLPSGKKDRTEVLMNILNEERTVILYEAPHRLPETLNTLLPLGDRKIALLRELTKLHEELICGTVAEVISHFTEHEPRGEFVIVIDGRNKETEREKAEPSDINIRVSVESYSALGLSSMEAIKQTAKDYSLPKSIIYNIIHKADLNNESCNTF